MAVKRKFFEKQESDFIIVEENRGSHNEKHIEVHNLEGGYEGSGISFKVCSLMH